MDSFTYKPEFINKVKERAYYMYLEQTSNDSYSNNSRSMTDLERYYEALSTETRKYIIDLHDDIGCSGECPCQYFNYCEICYKYLKKEGSHDCDYCGFYCKDCIRQFLFNKRMNHVNKIVDYDKFKLQCPTYDKCEIGFYVKDFITKDEYYNLANKIDFKIYYCIQPKCNGVIKGNECDTCNNKVCHGCNKEAHEGECKKEDVENLNCLLEHAGNDINKCPSCDMVLFLKHGCKNVFCWNCSVMFDWITSEILHRFEFSGKNYYDIYKGQTQLEYDKNGEKLYSINGININELADDELDINKVHKVRLEHFQPGDDLDDYIKYDEMEYYEDDYL